MKTIAIANQKGGVGKTTTAINLAHELALAGQRTLLIDFDPQGNCNTGLGKTTYRNGIYEVLNGVDINECISSTINKNMYAITSNQHLAAAEVELVSRERREFQLKDALNKLQVEFDVVIIDCCPSLGFLTINALNAAEWIIVPTQSEFYSLIGLSLLIETVARVKQSWNPKLDILGLLLTMHTSRSVFQRQIANDVQKHFGKKVFETTIPRTVRLAEASSFGQCIAEYDKQSTAALAYKIFAAEVLARIAEHGKLQSRG